MTIRQFVPVALAVIAGLTYGATQVSVPPVPIALITAFASVLLALQLEDRKLGEMLEELIRALKTTSNRV